MTFLPAWPILDTDGALEKQSLKEPNSTEKLLLLARFCGLKASEWNEYFDQFSFKKDLHIQHFYENEAARSY